MSITDETAAEIVVLLKTYDAHVQALAVALAAWQIYARRHWVIDEVEYQAIAAACRSRLEQQAPGGTLTLELLVEMLSAEPSGHA